MIELLFWDVFILPLSKIMSILPGNQGNRSPPSFQCSSVGTPMLDTAQQVGITTQERGNEEGGTEILEPQNSLQMRQVFSSRIFTDNDG